MAAISQIPIHLPVNPDANVYASRFAAGFGQRIPLWRGSGEAGASHQSLSDRQVGIGRHELGGAITVRDVLLVVQIAICAVLVTSSMVAVRGLVRSLHSNFGFEPRNAMLADTDLTMAGYSGDSVPAMQKRMIDAVETIPGVESVGLIDSATISQWERRTARLSLPTKRRI